MISTVRRFGNRVQIGNVGLKTKDQDRIAGWPPYVVAGVAMKKDDPRDPKFELAVIIRCVLDAVESFNSHGLEKIETVAFGSDWIGLKKLDPAEAGEIIRRTFEEHRAKNRLGKP
jgi:hypothetical protein